MGGCIRKTFFTAVVHEQAVSQVGCHVQHQAQADDVVGLTEEKKSEIDRNRIPAVQQMKTNAAPVRLENRIGE